MPAFRNISPIQTSGCSGIHSPAIFSQEQGWQNPAETINPLSYHNVKVEQLSPTYGLSYCQLSPSSSFSSSSSQSTYADSPSSVSSHRSTRTKRRNDPDYIPRPRNAFIFFRSFYLKSLANPEVLQNELSKNAAVVWKSMSGEQKAPFCEQACAERELHHTMYPNYVYAPARNLAKKRRATNVEKPSSIGEEDKWSRSSVTSSESPSPGPSFASMQSSRRSLGSSSYNLISILDAEFIPTSEIPDLELSPKEEKCSPEPIPYFALDPSPFRFYLDYVPEQFAGQQRCGDMDPTLPPLPRSVTVYNADYPLTSTSAPSSLLCDNPYPSADYLASVSSSSYSNSCSNRGQIPDSESYYPFDLDSYA